MPFFFIYEISKVLLMMVFKVKPKPHIRRDYIIDEEEARKWQLKKEAEMKKLEERWRREQLAHNKK